MNTATQLLERALDYLEIEYSDQSALVDGIEAYLEKQQDQGACVTCGALQGDQIVKQAKQQVEQGINPYEQAIDDELVNSFLGTKDDFKDAKTALLALIDFHCAVALDPSVSAQISKQVEQEPIYTTGAPLIFAIKLINSDLTLIENIKTREDLNIVIKSIRDQLQAISDYANKIITPSPQAREPMSDDTLEYIFQSVADSDDEVHIRFARAIEAHHGIK